MDVLIANAGYDPRYDGLEMSDAEWMALFQLNVTHCFVTCRGLPRLDRPALHAAVLGFRHPATGERMRFTSEVPADLRDALEALRAGEG